MLAYWFLYVLPAIPAFVGVRRPNMFSLPWIAVGLLFILAIGFREQVGGDWDSYLIRYDSLIEAPVDQVLASDPGYRLLNRLMAKWDWQIYGINTVCGAIFILGLFAYCRQLPAPWLGFAVAVPYLIIVMAMGYTRQSVALGFFLLALADIERGHFLRYILWVALGTTFHKSAVLLVPLGIFTTQRKSWFWRVIAVATAAYGLWDLFLEEHQEDLWKLYYVDQKMESQGARIRVLMNLVPSLLLLLYAKRWKQLFPAYQVWFWLSIAALISVVFVDFATTAVDRISLYFTPLQVAVFARLPVLLGDRFPPPFLRLGILMGYAAVLFVWLNYATHAKYWLPYRNILLQ
ncbi:EpsG family protein [Candidatus Thiosymbion oneisti]|uniref:EpsG family protein n=1 Tax=Candidatus Thiosymbion oneisti TaxID=589554 RepID=UPI000B7E6D89|nr:EpsG family protein [Candidatus Thiosymbion oneisti]